MAESISTPNKSGSTSSPKATSAAREQQDPPTKTETTSQDQERELEVDPKLDNRVGDQRPHLAEEIKPQQRHGGYPGDDTDYEDPPSSGEHAGGVTGHQAVGPHGRGEQTGPSSED